MTFASAKIFLYVVVDLTICQYAQSQYLQPVYANFENDIYDDLIKIEDNGKIAGGEFAKLGDFPYMAVVHRLVGNGLIEQCGGTIISKRWVLTAAHCAEKYPRRFFVVFGIVDKSNAVGYDFLEGPGVSMITTQAYIHSQYIQTKRTVRNDIALLYMPEDIPFSTTIQPIRLAYQADSFANENVFAIGWGKESSFSTSSSRLKYTVLTIIENDVCKQYWRITSNEICTASGEETGQDACEGDSGGPLVVTKDGQDLQVGIVSYGDGFCPGARPAVFTRISSYTNWIRAITRIY